MKKYIFGLVALLCHETFSFATLSNDDRVGLLSGAELKVEASATISSGDFAPLWLSSNRQGLVSPYGNSAYERVSMLRDIENDSLKTWQLGYGVDVQAMQNAQSAFFIHQAYAELKFMKARLTVGSKEREVELRNNRLTSGGLGQGINARPIPEVLLYMDYFSIPFTNHWWKWRFHGGYGMTTDGRWQESWVYDKDKTRYTSNTLYHEKSIYWKIGDEERFPLFFEIGLQMFTQFGGTTHNIAGRGFDEKEYSYPQNIKAFWNALWPLGSSDVTDGAIQNVAGNTFGSYNMRLKWQDKNWSVAAYFERMFEDQSMLTVQYGIYDHLLGVEAELPKNPFVSHVLVEHLSTKDQAGAVYHDVTPSMPDHLAGQDNYYNHNIYTGWQHWGMGMGNPLLMSPIYNNPHSLYFLSNRTMAWHVGLDGNPTSELSWRALFTFTQDWGTYQLPLPDVVSQQHIMLEANYQPQRLKGWSATAALGLSHGEIIGNTFGGQLTIRKTFGF